MWHLFSLAATQRVSKINGRDVSELTIDWTFVAAYLADEERHERKAILETLAELRRALNS